MGCTSQPFTNREPQATLSVELEEIRAMSDTPMRKHVRDFLTTAAGEYQFRGSKGCNSIIIQAHDLGTERQVLVQVGKDKTWVGGTMLYPVDDSEGDACVSTVSQQLECRSSRMYTAGYGYTPVKMLTNFTITKDNYGKVIAFSLEQNVVPKMNINCAL